MLGATSQLRLVESFTLTLSGCRCQVHFVGLIAARPCLGGGETGSNLSGSYLFFRRRLFGVIRGIPWIDSFLRIILGFLVSLRLSFIAHSAFLWFLELLCIDICAARDGKFRPLYLRRLLIQAALLLEILRLFIVRANCVVFVTAHLITANTVVILDGILDW